MSTVKIPEQTVSSIECGLCGRDGGVHEGCELCHGAQRFNTNRSFSLSEERRGLNPDGQKARYGLYGEVGPRIVSVPGGQTPPPRN
jgi:hypothetical protein